MAREKQKPDPMKEDFHRILFVLKNLTKEGVIALGRILKKEEEKKNKK